MRALLRPICWIRRHKLVTAISYQGLGVSVPVLSTWCERCGKLHAEKILGH